MTVQEGGFQSSLNLCTRCEDSWEAKGKMGESTAEGESSIDLMSDPDLPVFLFVADFGFARYLQNNMMAATLCGSPMYMVSVFCLQVFLYCSCFAPPKQGFVFPL